MSAKVKYTYANFENDAIALGRAIRNANAATDADASQRAWTDVALTSVKLGTGVADLLANDPKWSGWVGLGVNIGALREAGIRIQEDYKKEQNINDVGAGDVLALIGGLADIGGNFLLKPGPTFVGGVVLKGLGLAAGAAQNLVGNNTIGTVIFGESYKTQIFTPAALPPTIKADGTIDNGAVGAPLKTPIVDPAGLGTVARNSNSYLTYGEGGDSVVVGSGGTLSDIWLTQKRLGNDFGSPEAFYRAVRDSNPEITNINQLKVGQTIFIPVKEADGTITYNFKGGAQVNTNAATGEYEMFTPNADGTAGGMYYSKQLTPGSATDYTLVQQKLGANDQVVEQWTTKHKETSEGSTDDTLHVNGAGQVIDDSKVASAPDKSSYTSDADTNGDGKTDKRYEYGEGDTGSQSQESTLGASGQVTQTTLRQTDDDGNTLITTTNANGSGTMQVLDSEGNVIGQASFQRTHNGAGAMDGEAGTVTALVGGNNVTYSAAFDDDFGLVSFDGSGGTGEDERDTSTTLGQVSLLGVQAIGGQAVNYSPVNASMAAADLDLADLWAYGGYSTNTDGTTSATPTLQASHELQQATATANPNLTGQSQLVAPPVAVAGNLSALVQLNKWAHDHADFTQGLNGAMTLLRGLQTNNKISITTGAFDLAKSFASKNALTDENHPYYDFFSTGKTVTQGISYYTTTMSLHDAFAKGEGKAIAIASLGATQVILNNMAQNLAIQAKSLVITAEYKTAIEAQSSTLGNAAQTIGQVLAVYNASQAFEAGRYVDGVMSYRPIPMWHTGRDICEAANDVAYKHAA